MPKRLERLSELEKRIEKTSPFKTDNRYRFNFAIYSLFSFVFLMLLIIILSYVFNNIILDKFLTNPGAFENIDTKLWDLKELLSMLLNSFGTIMGFILGYYFKNNPL